MCFTIYSELLIVDRLLLEKLELSSWNLFNYKYKNNEHHQMELLNYRLFRNKISHFIFRDL